MNLRKVSSSSFISNDIERSNLYNWLGVDYQLNGKHSLAERSLRQAVELYATLNCASQRLYMEIKTNSRDDWTGVL